MSEAIRYEKGSGRHRRPDHRHAGPERQHHERRVPRGHGRVRCATGRRKKTSIAGVIITSAKKTFFAGGDLNELIKVGKPEAKAFYDMVLTLKGQLRTLETLGKPVVAAINGAALGGGWEICLACHHRVALGRRFGATRLCRK